MRLVLFFLFLASVLTLGACKNDDVPCETKTWYQDADGDGLGSSTVTQEACEQPNGYVDNANDPDDGDANITNYPALEIAVREVKAGGRLEFEAARAAFIPLWTSQPNAIADGEFHAFFNIPSNDNDVFVGMTSWEEFSDFQNASNTVGGSAEGQAFFGSFDMKAFVVVEQTEGPFFNLESAAGPGQIIELAVRKVTPGTEEDFNNKRKPYIEALNASNGVVASYEFEVQGENTENLTVGMTLYNDFAAFSGVQQGVNQTQIAADYFGSFEIVTIQYINAYAETDLGKNDAQLDGLAVPEDVTQYGEYLYTSNFFNASIQRIPLNDPSSPAIFVPAATDSFTAGWGLRVDAANNRLLCITNRPYDFNPVNAKAGQVKAFNLSTGAFEKSWDLPAQAVGNSIDIDDNGYYYVGDIGPNTRIIRINPQNDEVTVWAEDAQWTQGGFGFGGHVYDGNGSIYAAHAGKLWHIPIQANGSVGTVAEVALSGSDGVNADGMTWAGNNVIYYCENDAFTPGANGIVHKIILEGEGATAGKAIKFQQGLTDPSGCYFGSYNFTNYLFVNESQFGAALGVDGTDPSFPFKVHVFQQ